jgi:hypothetical protein
MYAQTNLGASLAACLAFSSATGLASCLASCPANIAYFIPLELPDTVENQPVSRTCSRRTGLLDFTHYIGGEEEGGKRNINIKKWRRITSLFGNNAKVGFVARRTRSIYSHQKLHI